LPVLLDDPDSSFCGWGDRQLAVMFLNLAQHLYARALGQLISIWESVEDIPSQDQGDIPCVVD
jgi:hypothetical protein